MKCQAKNHFLKDVESTVGYTATSETGLGGGGGGVGGGGVRRPEGETTRGAKRPGRNVLGSETSRVEVI